MIQTSNVSFNGQIMRKDYSQVSTGYEEDKKVLEKWNKVFSDPNVKDSLSFIANNIVFKTGPNKDVFSICAFDTHGHQTLSITDKVHDVSLTLKNDSLNDKPAQIDDRLKPLMKEVCSKIQTIRESLWDDFRNHIKTIDGDGFLPKE